MPLRLCDLTVVWQRLVPSTDGLFVVYTCHAGLALASRCSFREQELQFRYPFGIRTSGYSVPEQVRRDVSTAQRLVFAA